MTTVLFGAGAESSFGLANGKQFSFNVLGVGKINKYFSSNYNARRCILTAYAKANGAYTSSGYMKDGTSTCCWWLRSPGIFRTVSP